MLSHSPTLSLSLLSLCFNFVQVSFVVLVTIFDYLTSFSLFRLVGARGCGAGVGTACFGFFFIFSCVFRISQSSLLLRFVSFCSARSVANLKSRQYYDRVLKGKVFFVVVLVVAVI